MSGECIQLSQLSFLFGTMAGAVLMLIASIGIRERREQQGKGDHEGK